MGKPIVSSDLRSWIACNAPLHIREQLVSACCSRGKRSGRVLASVPTSKGPQAVGAWRAMMAELAASRAGLFALMWATQDEKDSFYACEAWMRESCFFHYNDQLLKLKNSHIVQLAGGAPLEFNLLHMRADADMLRAAADHIEIDADAMGAAWCTNPS